MVIFATLSMSADFYTQSKIKSRHIVPPIDPQTVTVSAPLGFVKLQESRIKANYH
jgi:hypothetical protein